MVVGAATVARFELWAPVDELAHYDYVHVVAHEQRLPVAGRDRLSPAVAATQGTDLAQPATTPAQRLARESYEAFQPPLYYVLAAPVLRLGGDHPGGARAVRALDLLLLLAAVAALADLCRLVAGRRGLLVLAAVLGVVLWPGVVVRSITVSNAPLELLLALAFLGQLWRAHARHDPRRLVLAGALLGLALLTKLTSVYLAPLLVGVAAHVHRERGRPALAAAALALALPVLLLAPWVASNVDRYGALTPNAVARAQQRPFLEAAGVDVAPGVPAANAALVGGVLPQEWEDDPDLAGVRPLAGALALVTILGALALAGLAVVRRDRWRLAVLAGPAALAVLMANLTLLFADWSIFLPRYLYPALLSLVVLGAATAARGARGRRLLVAWAALGSLAVGVVWLDAAGMKYFTDVGAALGL